MELSSLTYLEPIRNTALHRKILWLLAIFTWLFLIFPPTSFSQYDYVPGMEKFPDIDITHYDLHAEFFPDTIIVKARTDLVIFEIDRRVKISRANDYFCDQAPGDFTFILPKNYEILTSGHEVSYEIEENRKISQWKSFGSSNYYFVLAGPFIRYTFDDQVPKMIIDMDVKDSYALKAAKEKATNILKYY